MPGYWRSNNVTDDFIKCLYTPACLGIVAPDYNPMGDCATHYSGILCTECDPGYSSTSSYACAECPSTGANATRIIFIMIAVIIALTWLIRYVFWYYINIIGRP
jgi:hypothetical protein